MWSRVCASVRRPSSRNQIWCMLASKYDIWWQHWESACRISCSLNSIKANRILCIWDDYLSAVSGAVLSGGVLAWLPVWDASRLERGADLHMVQLMPLPLTVSCFSKIRIRFTFLVPAHPVSPGQRAVKRVCVFKCYMLILFWKKYRPLSRVGG